MITIQINTDNHIKGSENLVAKFTEMIQDRLGRFEEHLTRIEVFFADENNAKAGVDDKKCTIEVRMKGKTPEAVTYNADTLDHACKGAIEKVKSLLSTKIGEMQSHQQ